MEPSRTDPDILTVQTHQRRFGELVALIVLIEEIEAAGRGHTRRSAHQNSVGLSDFFQ